MVTEESCYILKFEFLCIKITIWTFTSLHAAVVCVWAIRLTSALLHVHCSRGPLSVLLGCTCEGTFWARADSPNSLRSWEKSVVSCLTFKPNRSWSLVYLIPKALGVSLPLRNPSPWVGSPSPESPLWTKSRANKNSFKPPPYSFSFCTTYFPTFRISISSRSLDKASL